MKSAIEAFVELRQLDKNTLSCLREDLESIKRQEVSFVSSTVVPLPEVHSRYMNGLDIFLDLVCALEGYDRHEEVVPTVVEQPSTKQVEVVESEEEPSKKWVAA